MGLFNGVFGEMVVFKKLSWGMVDGGLSFSDFLAIILC